MRERCSKEGINSCRACQEEKNKGSIWRERIKEERASEGRLSDSRQRPRLREIERKKEGGINKRGRRKKGIKKRINV